MSDTPRTDACLKENETDALLTVQGLIQLCRRLERENARLMADSEALRA
jgi:hypothetical protein